MINLWSNIMINGIQTGGGLTTYPKPRMPLNSVPVSAVSMNALSVQRDTVSLSVEGKALLRALQEIEKDSKLKQSETEGVSDQVESFAHGALGINHPDAIEEEGDTSYSAGQYMSAALTVGGILLALA
ncbi:hypothetical protein GNP79_07375 [Aliivibrio fischeri]|uniref:Uncharacterized protein n=2 Tax=Aliivibrio fischeri TaxID=668 RepID=A0A6N3YWZ0_ALIFS|nr:hypothetical protein [Aliivibrio fischeri]MUK80625.1 hypothetical protein [Aliivibrio fischeri]MUK84366.1 hypothetical protein [Aliivibrio fischeri]MUL15670.1 hypothetical protein [Aliivibrio fischeri]